MYVIHKAAKQLYFGVKKYSLEREITVCHQYHEKTRSSPAK